MNKKSFILRAAKLGKCCLVLFIVLVFASTASLYLFVSPEWAEGKLARFSQEKLQLELRLSGPVTLSHLPRIEVRVPSGSFIDPADGTVAGTFESAQLSISPWGLPFGQIHVSKAIFTGLKTAVRIPSIEQLRAYADSPLFKTSESWIAPLVIRRFRLDDSEIQATGGPLRPFTLRIKSLESSELAPRMTPSVRLEASAESNDGALKADISSSGQVDFDVTNGIFGLRRFQALISGRIEETAFSAKAETERFQYVGQGLTSPELSAMLDWGSASPVSVNFTASGLSTRGNLIQGEALSLKVLQKLEGGTQSLKLHSDFSIDSRTGALSLPGLKCEYTVAADNLPSVEASLQGKAEANLKKPALSVTASGTFNDSPVRLDGEWGASPSPFVKAALSADQLDLTPKSGASDALDLRGLFADRLRPLSSAFKGARMEADVKVKSLRYGLLNPTDLSASIALKDGGIGINGIEAHLSGGRISGAVDAAPDGAWNARLSASGIRYEELARAAGVPNAATGLLDGKLSLNGSLLDDSSSGRASGKADFNLASGTLPSLARKPLPFERLEGTAEIRGGIASCGLWRLTSKTLDAHGSAEMDLRTLSIAGEALLRAEGREVTASLDGSVFAPEWILSEPLQAGSPAAQAPAEAAERTQPTSEPATAPAAQPPAQRSWAERLRDWARKKLPWLPAPG